MGDGLPEGRWVGRSGNGGRLERSHSGVSELSNEAQACECVGRVLQAGRVIADRVIESVQGGRRVLWNGYVGRMAAR